MNHIIPTSLFVQKSPATGPEETAPAETDLESQTPLGRIGQTEDIAPAAVFFASSDSKWITGETLLIAGGLR